jgi:hypothetical protein
MLEVGRQCHAFHHPVELLNTLLPSGLPPHKLVLKVGAPVVFIRNLNREQGIMNGTRGVIQSCPRDITFTRIVFMYYALRLLKIPFTGPTDHRTKGWYICGCATDKFVRV